MRKDINWKRIFPSEQKKKPKTILDVEEPNLISKSIVDIGGFNVNVEEYNPYPDRTQCKRKAFYIIFKHPMIDQREITNKFLAININKAIKMFLYEWPGCMTCDIIKVKQYPLYLKKVKRTA